MLMTGVMSAHGSEVKVYVRIRPTACFAEELIEYLPDKQVIMLLYHYITRNNTP